MRLLREPLIHFGGLGALIFVLHRLVAPVEGPASAEAKIVADEQKRRELHALFEERQGRAPTAAEERELVERWIEDELLFREALRIELVREDAALRDQLVGRMRSLVQASAGARVASDEDLRRYFEAHRANYRQPASVTFKELAVKPGSGAEDAVRALVQQLSNGESVTGLPMRHERFALPEVEGGFGAEFKQRLERAPLNQWQVLRSHRGLHAVMLEERREAADPSFEDLHDRLANDLRREQAQDHFRQELTRLRRQFLVAQGGPLP